MVSNIPMKECILDKVSHKQVAVPHKQCETATCLLKKKTKKYISHFWLRAGVGSGLFCFLEHTPLYTCKPLKNFVRN